MLCNGHEPVYTRYILFFKFRNENLTCFSDPLTPLGSDSHIFHKQHTDRYTQTTYRSQSTIKMGMSSALGTIYPNRINEEVDIKEMKFTNSNLIIYQHTRVNEIRSRISRRELQKCYSIQRKKLLSCIKTSLSFSNTREYQLAEGSLQVLIIGKIYEVYWSFFFVLSD